MSDYYLDGDEGPDADVGRRSEDEPHRRGRGRMGAVLLVLLLALAGFGGIVWYAYSNARNTAPTGEPPLVKADTGPVRIRPEQPGGLEVPHQDRLVLQELNPNHAAAVVEQILPPPEEPLPRPEPPAPAQTATDAQASPQPAPSLPDERPGDADLRISTRAPSIVVPEAPSPATAISPPPSVPRPQPSPAANAEAKPETAAEPEPEARPVEQPSTGGSHRIQMAAVRSQEAARSEWQRLQRQHPDLLGSMQLQLQQIDLGEKGIYYRVQAGPLSDTAAESACASLKARSTDCIVVNP